MIEIEFVLLFYFIANTEAINQYINNTLMYCCAYLTPFFVIKRLWHRRPLLLHW